MISCRKKLLAPASWMALNCTLYRFRTELACSAADVFTSCNISCRNSLLKFHCGYSSRNKQKVGHKPFQNKQKHTTQAYRQTLSINKCFQIFIQTYTQHRAQTHAHVKLYILYTYRYGMKPFLDAAMKNFNIQPNQS